MSLETDGRRRLGRPLKTDDEDDDDYDDIPLIVTFPLAVREPAHNNPCGLLL